MYCGFIKIRLPVIPIFQWEFVVELIHITKCSLECKVYHIALKGSIYPENYDLCIIFKKFLTVLKYSMQHGRDDYERVCIVGIRKGLEGLQTIHIR